MVTTSRPSSPTPSALPPIPSSPTYSYASTAVPIPSSFNLPLPPPPILPQSILTKADLDASQTAYSELLSTAKAYRLALAALSSSASSFGSALEACARLKEARSPSLNQQTSSMSNSFTIHGGAGTTGGGGGNCTADSLLAASGLHQLIANHQQILSETVYRSFEVPLLSELDVWRRRIEEEEEAYQREAKGMSKEIRKMEKEGIRLHGKRKRDVGVFREHLVRLTGKLDGLTGLHGNHARGLLREGQEMSLGIVECAAGLVRAEVDIFEALARKGWTGGGLDELLERGKDLFANDVDAGDGNHNSHSKIFSILPQKSILANSEQEGGAGSGRPVHQRNDSLLVEGHTYQSLAGAVSTRRDTDASSIFSERDNTTGILNRSRGVRPFSPPPMERVAKDPLELNPDMPKTVEEEETLVDQGSPRTVVQVSVSPPENGKGRQLDEGTDEESSVDGRSSSGRMMDRERRWSVTDDGVVSD